MSTSFNYIIEYKDTKDNKWKPVKIYYPHISNKLSILNREKNKWEDITPSEKTSTIEGEKLDCFFMPYVQGTIRDLFCRYGKFYDRGLPENISEEAYKAFDEKDLYYSKSYATLSELLDYENELIERLEKTIKKYFKQKEESEIIKLLYNISKKLDIKTKVTKEKEVSNLDYTIEEAEETFDNYCVVSNFISSIQYVLVDIMDIYADLENIRIVGGLS